MYKRILVPVDGSKFSEEILPYAIGLAQTVPEVELSLLRIVEKAADLQEATTYVEQLASATSGHGVAAKAKAIVANDDIPATILAESRATPGTLVAMTTRGRSGLVATVLGGVARQVLRIVNAPVFLYHPHGKARDAMREPIRIRRVVLPVDGGAVSEAIVAQAGQMAKWLGAEIMVVSVLPSEPRISAGIPSGDIQESSYVRVLARELGAKYAVSIGWEVLHGDPVDAITQFVSGNPGTMLTMVTRGRGPLETTILGSVTAGCLRESGVPVLARMP